MTETVASLARKLLALTARVTALEAQVPAPAPVPTPVPVPPPAPLPPPAPPAPDRLMVLHYVPWYPPSFRGTAGGNVWDDAGGYYDWYTNIAGDGSGAWGAFLRDRPLPATALPSTTTLPQAWLADQRAEMRAIKAGGWTATAIDLVSFDDFASRNWSIVRAHVDAGAAEGVPVFPMLDTTGGLGASCTPAQAAAALLDLARRPGCGQVDGHPLLSVFTPETRTAAFWDAVDAALVAGGLDHRWLWCVQQWDLGWAKRPRTWGMSAWGGRNPAFAVSERPRGAQAHAAGVKWLQTLAVQDQRPRDGIYDEAVGTQTLREYAQSARESSADGVLGITAQDFSESTQLLPSANHGGSLAALVRLHLDWIRTGTKPAPTGDLLVLAHRKHHSAAALPAGRSRMTLRGGSTPTTDVLEVTTWLHAPATVAVTLGPARQEYPAPAGEYVRTFPVLPTTTGAPTASLARDSAVSLVVTSRHAITTSPAQQDLAYYATHGST